ncbi:Inorganic pyrophosphatase [bacterium HR35]|nr:Inorganic pyrophosphatase [bacterium HR35]
MDFKNLNKNLTSFEEFYVVIEIPKDTSVKYELDKENGFLKVDRFLHTAMVYPFNYGFMPHTLADDGDPVDVLVICDLPVLPGSVIKVKPIGVLIMEDEAGLDEKILAVPVSKIDPIDSQYQDINEIPEAIKNKIKHFFENYKSLEPGKWVKVKDWLNRKEAISRIEKAYKNYKEN